jgi:hypothetical protein
MNFHLGDLISGAIRQSVTGTGGLRQFAGAAIANTNSNGGILGALTSALGWIVGKIFGALSGFIAWSLPALWGALCSTVAYIWNFNWNMPKVYPEKQLKSLIQQTAALVGFELGQAIGYLTCGVLPGSAMFTFNEALAVHVLNKVGEKALHTLTASTELLLQATIQQGFPVLIDFLYVEARTAALPFLVKAGLVSAQDAQKIGADDAKPWSFALKTQEAIHHIKNENIKTLVEVAYQTATQTCVEAGYVVANSIEEYIAKQRLAHQSINGVPGAYEIIFNRSTGTTSTTAGSP